MITLRITSSSYSKKEEAIAAGTEIVDIAAIVTGANMITITMMTTMKETAITIGEGEVEKDHPIATVAIVANRTEVVQTKWMTTTRH